MHDRDWRAVYCEQPHFELYGRSSSIVFKTKLTERRQLCWLPLNIESIVAFFNSKFRLLPQSKPSFVAKRAHAIFALPYSSDFEYTQLWSPHDRQHSCCFAALELSIERLAIKLIQENMNRVKCTVLRRVRLVQKGIVT